MNLLKKIGLKIKVIAIGIVSIISFILFFVVRGKLRKNSDLDYELEKVKKEMELTRLEDETSENLSKMKELKKKELLIRDKIKFIEERKAQSGEDVSEEELENFFKNRGV